MLRCGYTPNILSRAYTRVVAHLGAYLVPSSGPVWFLVLFEFREQIPCPCASARLTTVLLDFLCDFGSLSILTSRNLHRLWWKVISTISRAGSGGNPPHTIWGIGLVIQVLGPKVVYCGPRVTVLHPSPVSYGPSSSQNFLWKVLLFSQFGYIDFFASGVFFVLLVTG